MVIFNISVCFKCYWYNNILGDQSIEKGFHQSYSGSIAPTCPDNRVKWYIFENLNCK